jgi:hypothetical protein
MTHLFASSSCWISVGLSSNKHDCLNKREFGSATCKRHRYLENDKRAAIAIASKPARAMILEAEQALNVDAQSIPIKIPSPPQFVNNIIFVRELNMNINNIKMNYSNINITFCSGKVILIKKIRSTKNNEMITSYATSKNGRQYIKSLPSKKSYKIQRFKRTFELSKAKRTKVLNNTRHNIEQMDN